MCCRGLWRRGRNPRNSVPPNPKESASAGWQSVLLCLIFGNTLADPGKESKGRSKRAESEQIPSNEHRNILFLCFSPRCVRLESILSQFCGMGGDEFDAQPDPPLKLMKSFIYLVFRPTREDLQHRVRFSIGSRLMVLQTAASWTGLEDRQCRKAQHIASRLTRQTPALAKSWVGPSDTPRPEPPTEDQVRDGRWASNSLRGALDRQAPRRWRAGTSRSQPRHGTTRSPSQPPDRRRRQPPRRTPGTPESRPPRKKDSSPRTETTSFAMGIAQPPSTSGSPAEKAGQTSAGISVPTSAAMASNAAPPGTDKAPAAFSRLVCGPIWRKKITSSP